jgi:iron complex outermembrane receptor protein
MFRAHPRLATIAIIAAFFVFVAHEPAIAQNQQVDHTTGSQAAEANATDAQTSQTLEQIVVTGSRIARPNEVADSPILAVSEDALSRTTSFTLDSQLNRLPQFAGNGVNGQFDTGFTSVPIATLNLRSLGDNRNLVLLDGRRLEPSSATFAVDLNNIPSNIIESTEIITGGASAVYGSDAVAGVVNFKLKKTFSGIQLDARYGQAGRGDYGNESGSALIGGDYADGAGNAFVSVDVSNRNAIYAQNRPFYDASFRTAATGNSFLAYPYYEPGFNPPEQAAVNGYFASFGASAGAVSNLADLGVNPGGTSLFNLTGPAIYNYTGGVYPQNPYYAISTNATGKSVMYNSYYGGYASSPLSRVAVFGRSQFKLNDSLTLFVQGQYAHINSEVENQAPIADQFWGATVPVDAAHPVPAALGALLASRANPTAPWSYGQTLTYLGQLKNRYTNDVEQVTGGLDGLVPQTDWTYEIYGSHGQTDLLATGVSGFGLSNRYQQLIAAPNYGAGFTLGPYTCTSGISPFIDPSAVSQDCINYIKATPKTTTQLTQDVAEATIQGGLSTLPAGQLRFALGADYRRNTFNNSPDSVFQPTLPFGSASVSYIFTNFGSVPTSGSESVREAYTELLVPVVRDLPLIQSLNLDVGYRYSDYKLSGGANTFKIDADWQMADSLRLRGGYSRAVRAPNVTELFGGSQPSLTIPSFDPCTTIYPFVPYSNTPSNPNRSRVIALCQALIGPAAATVDFNNYSGLGIPTALGYTSGNPHLSPEVADTYTVGAVIHPSGSLPLDSRFSFSADYYNIKIARAISFLNAGQVYQQCFNANGASNPTYDPNNIYCKAILRAQFPGSQGIPLDVQSTYMNQGGLKTDGIDVQLDWSDLAIGPGRLNLGSVVTYLHSFRVSIAPGSAYREYAGTEGAGAYFHWKAVTNASYRIGPVMAGMDWRLLGSARDSSTVSNPSSTVVGVPNYSLFDLSLVYDLSSKLQLSAGVENLADKQPPVVGGIPGATDANSYDTVGRSFYVVARARF